VTETKTESTLTCEKHGEYIATTTTTFHFAGGEGYEYTTPCPTCNEELIARQEREQAERAEQEHRQLVARNRAKANIPERFAASTFANYEAGSTEQQHALLAAKGFAENFAAVRDAGNSMTFYGSPGNGKTHLACAIANHLLGAEKTVVYTTVLELIRGIRDTWRRDSNQSEADVVRMYQNADLLIVDEVGVSFGSEAEKNQLFDVLDGRYREMRPTLIVSNLSLKGLRGCLGERIYDRLMQNGSGCVRFDWKSYRPEAPKPITKPRPQRSQAAEQARLLALEAEYMEAGRKRRAEADKRANDAP
jgi:DNA replication protein DnaC